MRLTTLLAVAIGVVAAAPAVQAQSPRMMRRGTVQPAPSYIVPSSYPMTMPMSYTTPVMNGQVMPGVYYPSMMPGTMVLPFTPATSITPTVTTGTTSSGVVTTGATTTTTTEEDKDSKPETSTTTAPATTMPSSGVVVGQPYISGPVVTSPFMGYGSQPVMTTGYGQPMMNAPQYMTSSRPARRGLFRRR